MNVRGYDLTKAQYGWICDTCFTVTTAQQFTAEEHVIRAGSRWAVLAVIKGYLAARRRAARLAAKSGERALKGWAN